MRCIHFIVLQAGSPGYVAAVAFVGILVLFLSTFIILQAWVNRNKKNILQMENALMKERYDAELLRNKVDVQEATFESLGKELHDNVGQILVTARMLLGAAERGFERPPVAMTLANQHLHMAIEEIRSLSKALNREWLQQFDLAHNLAIEIDRLKNTGIKLAFNQQNNLTLDNECQFILFRVMQEAIKNAIEHSGTLAIDIILAEDTEAVRCCIGDYGSGFQLKNNTDGLGIRNMKQRIQSIKGTVNWLTGPEGTRVIIEIPTKSS